MRNVRFLKDGIYGKPAIVRFDPRIDSHSQHYETVGDYEHVLEDAIAETKGDNKDKNPVTVSISTELPPEFIGEIKRRFTDYGRESNVPVSFEYQSS